MTATCWRKSELTHFALLNPNGEVIALAVERDESPLDQIIAAVNASHALGRPPDKLVEDVTALVKAARQVNQDEGPYFELEGALEPWARLEV